MAGSNNTLIMMMGLMLVVGVGAFFLLRKKSVDVEAEVGPGGPGEGGSLYAGYIPAGGIQQDIDYYAFFPDFDRHRYDRDRDYRDRWDRDHRRHDHDDKHHWWEFWKGWNDDGDRTDDRTRRYYWERFGWQLRSMGMDDDDIDDFVRWVSKRNRSEREISKYIEEKLD